MKDNQKFNFEFIYGNQENLISELDYSEYFYIPDVFFKDEPFKAMSVVAKLLYGYMLELMRKNGNVDKENRLYINYGDSVHELHRFFHLSSEAVLKGLKELENIGLIEKEQTSFILPSIIYVKDFSSIMV